MCVYLLEFANLELGMARRINDGSFFSPSRVIIVVSARLSSLLLPLLLLPLLLLLLLVHAMSIAAAINCKCSQASLIGPDMEQLPYWTREKEKCPGKERKPAIRAAIEL